MVVVVVVDDDGEGERNISYLSMVIASTPMLCTQLSEVRVHDGAVGSRAS